MSPSSSAMEVFLSLTRFGGMYYCASKAYDTVKCVGPSMLPTLNRNGDIVFLDKLSLRYKPIEIGEVVIAKSMTNPKQTVCKRVLAKEGNTVVVRQHYGGERHYKVPKNHVWLEGDNKHDSHDSRYYGPVPYAMIEGRVRWRIWPLHQFGRI